MHTMEIHIWKYTPTLQRSHMKIHNCTLWKYIYGNTHLPYNDHI